MSSKHLDYVVKKDGQGHVINMTLEAGDGSTISIEFKVGEIKNMPDPTLADLRNIALSWGAHRLLEQLPENYLDGKAKYVPGPRSPQK